MIFLPVMTIKPRLGETSRKKSKF